VTATASLRPHRTPASLLRGRPNLSDELVTHHPPLDGVTRSTRWTTTESDERKQSMFEAPTRTNVSIWLTRAGQIVSRYGLVVVLAWIGFGKYSKMEARVLIEHSPLMSWIYDVLSVHAVAVSLGTTEIIAAVLIALRPVWPRVSAVGSAMAVVLFLGTVSFLFTTPNLVVAHYAGLPVLGAQPGQFLLKDLVVIGVSLWTLGDSLHRTDSMES
jgi:uncharacterized membrane protein YkgB